MPVGPSEKPRRITPAAADTVRSAVKGAFSSRNSVGMILPDILLAKPKRRWVKGKRTPTVIEGRWSQKKGSRRDSLYLSENPLDPRNPRCTSPRSAMRPDLERLLEASYRTVVGRDLRTDGRRSGRFHPPAVAAFGRTVGPAVAHDQKLTGKGANLAGCDADP